MYSEELKSTLNRYLDVGHIMVTKNEILQATNGDLALSRISLNFWQSSGWLIIRLELSNANNDDACVELRQYIDNDKPWSDPMSGKM